MKNLLLSVLLVGQVGCAKPIQRFVPVGNNLALDTKTGRECRTNPQFGVSAFPLCYDLYRGKD